VAAPTYVRGLGSESVLKLRRVGLGLAMREHSAKRLAMKITSIPQLYRNVNRWREFLAVLSKYGLAGGISRLDLHFAKGLLKDPDGEVLALHTPEARIRLALVELGPTFIKLGQILSTRPDLVGVQLAQELTHLQTEVRADPGPAVRARLESELGRPVCELFADFEEVPFASASIAQVHRARLLTGQLVAVKVQHLGIEETIRVDLEIIAGFAELAEKMPEFANYQPRVTAAEFQQMLLRELDFGREERSMRQFAHDFAADPSVRIPRSYPELSTSRVLTMELLEGMNLSEVARCGGSGLDLELVARRGAELYLEMIFGHGFYHADPHPGNVLLLSDNVIGLLDFGMVGRLDGQLRERIEEMLLAVIGRDGDQLTSLVVRMGAAPTNLDFAALNLDVTEFVSHYATQSLADFNLTGALNEMTEIIRRHHIRLPAGVGMLIKSLVMLEGTSRLLAPRFNLMEVMRPYRKRMLLRRISPMRKAWAMRRIYSELEQLAQVLPRRVAGIARQIESGDFDVHLDHRGLEPSVNRLVLGMLASSLFVGSSLLLAHKVPPVFHDVSVLGLGTALASLFLALRLWRAINKSGHLDRKR